MGHVVIIGAGVVGVVNAYYLLRAGHEVTIIDKNEQSALGASGANVSCLHNAYIHPKGEPSLYAKLPSILAGQKPLLAFRDLYKPFHVKWGSGLLFESLPTRTLKNQKTLEDMAAQSYVLRQQMKDELYVECDYQRSGKLIVFENTKDLDATFDYYSRAEQETGGGKIQKLDRDALFEKEPALVSRENYAVGAVHFPNDDLADCQKYTQSLTSHMSRTYGDQFRFITNTQITGFKGNEKKVLAVTTSNDDGHREIQGDHFILAAGFKTKELAAKLGVNIPIIPAKGYTICVPYARGTDTLKSSVTYEARNLVLSPYEDRIRISSGFFIGEDNDDIKEDKIELIKTYAREILPDLDFFGMKIYMGHRPCLTSSIPQIKSISKYSNAYVNSGHGMYGWSLAHYSAKTMTDLINIKKA